MSLEQEGREPDYRFSLANERTFLAWLRTALAVLAGGVLLQQFAIRLEPRWAVNMLGASLAFAAALVAAAAFLQWRANQIAMRHDRPLPRSWLMPGITIAVVALASVTAVLML